MRRWLKKFKKYGRHFWTIMGLGFIANSIYGLVIYIPQGKCCMVLWDVVLIVAWLAIISYTSGLAEQIIIWWEND